MNIVRENSKGGDETHVLLLPSSSSGISGTSSRDGGNKQFTVQVENPDVSDSSAGIRGSGAREVLIEGTGRDSLLSGQGSNPAELDLAGSVKNLPKSEIPQPPATSRGRSGLDEVDNMDVTSHRKTTFEQHPDNENDSDPPVENYNVFSADFPFEDDDDDGTEDDLKDDLGPEGRSSGGDNDSEGAKGGHPREEAHDRKREHHSQNPLTAQEQRNQLRKRKAQGQFRKRKKSTNIDVNYIPPYKKRFRRQTSVLPSKFLLGGNIRDPLNLASLADAKVNAALNAATPKTSPTLVDAKQPPHFLRRHNSHSNNNNNNRQAEVPVFIPKNPDDPLGLQSEASSPYNFIAGVRKIRKHRHRKKGGRKRTDSECSVDKSEDSDGKGIKDTSMSSEEDHGKQQQFLKEKVGARDSVEKQLISANTVAAIQELPSSIPGTSGVDNSDNSGPKAEIVGKKIKDVQEIFEPIKESGDVTTESEPVNGDNVCSSTRVEVAEITSRKSDEPCSSTSLSSSTIESGGSAPVSELASDATLMGMPGKKKSRTRKRSRKGMYQPGFRPGHYFLQGKSSDYVPLGTPSVHESHFYEYYTCSPGSGQDFYESSSPPAASLPFESPSISSFNQENTACMEPFSPPPKPEVKRRRLDSSSDSGQTKPAAEQLSAGSDEPTSCSSIAPPSTEDMTSSTTTTTSTCGTGAKVTPQFAKPSPPNKLPLAGNHKRKRNRHKSDPIVSPVVPQPGSIRRRFNPSGNHFNNQNSSHQRIQLEAPSPSGLNFRKKDEIFQYGNYNRYYGYRTTEGIDLRLNAFPKDICQGKQVLDVGCNIGHVTMLIARDFKAERVVGIDIDPKLIIIAKKNVKHYVVRDPTNDTISFPHSCPLMYGVLQPPPGTSGDTRKIPFPYNMAFREENYVLESDDLLDSVQPEYDIILFLSISKWIHLNFGDEGIKRCFRRAYRNLRPGGKLILEPQPWSSYKKKKKLTEQIFATFKSIRLYPEMFQDYLLKEAGFSTMEKLATPAHQSKGFQRPLLIFTKAETTPNRSPPPPLPQLGLLEMTTTTVPASTSSLASSPNPSSSTACTSTTATGNECSGNTSSVSSRDKSQDCLQPEEQQQPTSSDDSLQLNPVFNESLNNTNSPTSSCDVGSSRNRGNNNEDVDCMEADSSTGAMPDSR